MRTTALFLTLLCACGSDPKPALIAKGEQAPRAVATDATYAYWLADGAPSAASAVVRRAPLGGGEATTLTSSFTDPRALVVSGGAVYWASGDGKVRSLPAAGGAPVDLATEPDGDRK